MGHFKRLIGCPDNTTQTYLPFLYSRRGHEHNLVCFNQIKKSKSEVQAYLVILVLQGSTFLCVVGVPVYFIYILP